MDSAELDRLAPWATALAAPERERAVRGLSRKSYAAGTTISAKGDRLPYWTGVETGLVKLAATSIDGKALTFASVGAGGWFGEGSMLKNETRKYDIVALRDTTLGRLDQSTFDWLAETSLAFNRLLVRLMNERISQFISTIELDRIFDPTARIARHIAWLVHPVLNPRVGSAIDISQDELATLAGVSRASANKSLQALEAAGLVDIGRGAIIVRQADRLRNYGEAGAHFT